MKIGTFILTSGTQTYTFTKGMYVYFNGSRWIKDALLVELNTSTVSIPVEPSHAVGYEIDDDDANYLASIGAAAILAQQTAEQSAQDVEDLRSGDLAFKVVAYDTTYSGEIAIGQTKWNGTFKCLETRVSDNVVIQHGTRKLTICSFRFKYSKRTSSLFCRFDRAKNGGFCCR